MLYQLSFKPLNEEDLLTVKEIYDYYIHHSTATFHTELITISELKEYIYINHPRYRSYLILCDEVPAGFCYYTHFKKRQAYDRTAEVAIYLRPEFCDKGIGPKALAFLEKEAKDSGIKNLIALVTGNNFPSIKLFERLGYKKVAHFEKVGEKLGQVLDVLAYQKEL
jgi:phosphinothricin acetyltransferase